MDCHKDQCLRVLRIVDGTSVDGPGLRTSIYLAGCHHHCEGCHNMHSWAFDQGDVMTVDQIMEHVDEQDYNVTLSGGDPLASIDSVLPLAKRLKEGNRHVWCYTGYTYEEVSGDPRLSKILDYIDVLVDGPFIQSQRDVGLLFRGSANQRLIDVKATLAGDGEIILVEEDVAPSFLDLSNGLL